jgi:tetratricopeptide (TPR) repeat protein
MDLLRREAALGAARWLALAAALAVTASAALSFTPPRVGPEKAAALRNELDQSIHDKQWEEALYEVQSLLRYFPQDSTYLSREARVYEGLEDWAAAARVYELALSVSPEPTESCPMLGYAYSKQGLEDKALDAHRRCLALQPGNSDMRIYYALALERAGRYQEAHDLFALVLADAPSYKDAALGLKRTTDRLNEGRK